MTEREIDDALGALRTTLQVEPSPAFAAGVRARIDRDWRTGWAAWLTWSAAAAVVVIGIVLLSRSASAPAIAPLVANAGSSTGSVLPGASPAQMKEIATPIHVVAPRVAAAGVGAAAPAPTHVRSGSHERVLEVLVPADERLALAKLLADLDAGRVEGAALVSKLVEPAPLGAPPSDLVIAPIEMPAIGGGGGVIK